MSKQRWILTEKKMADSSLQCTSFYSKSCWDCLCSNHFTLSVRLAHIPTVAIFISILICVYVCVTEREKECDSLWGSTWQLHNSTNSTVGGCVMLLCYKHDKSPTYPSLIVPWGWNASACCELIVTQRECPDPLKRAETICTWPKWLLWKNRSVIDYWSLENGFYYQPTRDEIQ